MSIQSLKDRWFQLTSHFVAQDLGAEIWQQLEGQYAQPPGRAYHNLNHISDCFAQLDQVLDLVGNRLAVELAIFFHDVVYDSQATVPFQNEEKSADVAAQLLRSAGLPDSEVHIVTRLILDTRHNEVAQTADGRLLVDIDLSILGAQADRFWNYEDQIRQEYSWVELSAYRSRRAKIMEGFLLRDRLYQTPYFYEKYEEVARHNLQALVLKMTTDN